MAHYIVSELLEGGTLRERLAQATASVHSDAALAEPSRSTETLLATRAATLATEPGTLLGTVGYMAPEQVRGLATDNRADIFAFGAILYEMLAGQRAFHGPTSADTMTAILEREPAG